MTHEELKREMSSQGLEFITNVAGHRMIVKTLAGKMMTVDSYGPLPTDDAIVNEYAALGFKDVQIATAYDRSGKVIENMRAVYARI